MSHNEGAPPNATVEKLRSRVLELDRRAAAAEAREALANAIDRIFEGFQIIDRDWRYVYVNSTAARQGGSEPGLLIGRTMMECYPGIDGTPLFPVLRRVMDGRQAERMENRFVLPSGDVAWFELLIEPVPQGISVLSIDVTVRRQLEEAARRTQADLEATLACMADAVVVTDVAGAIERCNPAAEALLGYTADELRGRPFDRVVALSSPRTAERLPSPVETILSRGGFSGFPATTSMKVRSGLDVPIVGSGAPLRDVDGVLRGVVMVFRDMTKEHGLQAQLNQAQKMETVGRFAGGVAHDFNNALSVILTTAALAAEQTQDGDPLREDLRQISATAEHAAGLTRQLLAVSRKQAGRPRVLDLGETVHDMHGMLQRLVPKNVALALVPGPRGLRVRADAGHLQQILMNLVVNAADAMPSGGRITVETSSVLLDEGYAAEHAGVSPGPHVALVVSDTGHGMSDEVKASAFEPFFTTKEAGKGTGLGLSIVYGIVKQNGGHVWLYSEVGHGTTFKIYLPAVEAAAEPATTRAEATAPGRGETILLVDDNEAVRASARRSLERHGYVILDAKGEGDALQVCEEQHRTGRPIHLLLTDVLLGRGRGAEVARAMRGRFPAMKIVLMSGYTQSTSVNDGVVAADDHFIEKPFTPSSLASKVRAVLDEPVLTAPR